MVLQLKNNPQVKDNGEKVIAAWTRFRTRSLLIACPPVWFGVWNLVKFG